MTLPCYYKGQSLLTSHCQYSDNEKTNDESNVLPTLGNQNEYKRT